MGPAGCKPTPSIHPDPPHNTVRVGSDGTESLLMAALQIKTKIPPSVILSIWGQSAKCVTLVVVNTDKQGGKWLKQLSTYSDRFQPEA